MNTPLAYKLVARGCVMPGCTNVAQQYQDTCLPCHIDSLGLPEPVRYGYALYLGPRITALRTEAKLMLVEVAQALSVHPSIIGLWAQDKRAVPYDRLEGLALALRTTTDRLLEGYKAVPHKATARPVPARVVPEIPPQPEPEPDPVPTVPARPPIVLAWCDHGGRRHHHGPLPTWALGPIVALKDLI
jgi:transcriptional regulator with XRE-family HTH domain